MPDGHRAPVALPALPFGAGATSRSVSKCGSDMGLPRVGLSDESNAWAPVFKAHRQSRVSVGAHSRMSSRTTELSDELSHDSRKRSKDSVDQAALAQLWDDGPGATAGLVQSARVVRSNWVNVPESDCAAKVFQRRSHRLHTDPVASWPQPAPSRRPRRVHTDPVVPRPPPAPPSAAGFPRHHRSFAEARPPAASPRESAEAVPLEPRKSGAGTRSTSVSSGGRPISLAEAPPPAASQEHPGCFVEAPPSAASPWQSVKMSAPVAARTSSSGAEVVSSANHGPEMTRKPTAKLVTCLATRRALPRWWKLGFASQVQEEVLWEEIYGKLKDRDIGEVHTDDLGRALDLAGCGSANLEWVKEIASQITHYSTLDQPEFFQFIEAYSRRQANCHYVAFYSCDKDKSGRLELPELPHVFDCIEFEVMPHILREMFEEVCNGERSIDIKGFTKMVELYKLRDGFSREEFEDLLHAFDRFDVDKSDSIDATEFASMLSWLGFSWSSDHNFRRPSLKRDAREIYDAADTDWSGSLNQREFIICMRKVRNLELEKIKRVIQENAMPGSEDRIQHAHLTRVFGALGYTFPDRKAIFEFAQECCGGDVHNGLNIGQVWQVVVQYRNRHGFAAAMKAEIQAAFDAHKSEHEVDIDHMQMPLVLRQLGFTLPLHVQRHITERVDVRSTGRIDLESAVRIVRRACEHGLARARQLFHLHKEEDPGGCAAISEEEAVEVLDGMGLDAFDGGATSWCAPPGDLAPGPGGRRLSEEGFLRAYARLAEADRRRLQANGGLSGGELRSLQDVFSHYDRDGTGIVKDQSLMRMLRGSFSEVGDPSFRPRLLELMAQVSPDGGGLDFAGFRRFCQLYVEMREKDALLKESRAIEKTSFSLAEVAELRSVFLATPGEPSWGGVVPGHAARGDRFLLSWSELRLTVLGSHLRPGAEVVPPGRGWGRALKVFLQEAMPERAEEDGEAQFDFSEFLVIMRAIADGKFASVL